MASDIDAFRVGEYTFYIVRLQCVRIIPVCGICGEVIPFPVVLIQSAIISTYPKIPGIRVFYDAADSVVAD